MNTKKVFRMYVDFEEEEQWLNSMADAGWNLEAFSLGNYTFVKGEKGEWVYRLELLDELPSHKKSSDYLEFLAGTGVEFVDAHLRWVYLRKKKAEGPFELYSDPHSKILHYKRIMLLFSVLGVANLVLVASSLILKTFTIFFPVFIWFTFLLFRYVLRYRSRCIALEQEKGLQG